MSKKRVEPAKLYREPEAVRRKLAAAYRALAADPQRPVEERAEFARMADAWAATLPGVAKRNGKKSAPSTNGPSRRRNQ